MSEILENYYNYAQLSLAAYADLSAGMSETNYKSALNTAGFSQPLADDFADRYTVLHQQTVGEFSATLFQALDSNGQPTGPKILAIRGTDSFLDALGDLNILFGTGGLFDEQYDALRSYYADLTNPGGLNLLQASDQIYVAGHSLGGYLAQTFTADPQYKDKVLHAYTYNAPGFGGIWAGIAELLHFFPGSVPNTQITNLFAQNGLSAISNLGTLIGAVQSLFIEEGSAFHNHSIITLTDSLALYSLFAQVDPTVNTDISRVTSILNAAATAGRGSLEQTLFDLRKLFQSPPGSLTPDTPLVSGDAASDAVAREAYYTNIGILTPLLASAPPGTYEVKSLVAGVDVVTEAEKPAGIAYRYALTQLNPFAIEGADYAQHNTNGELDRVNVTTGTGTLTHDYIFDRAQFLAKKIEQNLADSSTISGSTQFEDRATGYVLTPSALVLQPFRDFTIFGGDTAEGITGGGNDDNLYGGDGVDSLFGQGGRDYLEGNLGNDTLDGGADADTMLGGQGNDTYYVDNAGDIVTEYANNGSDTVQSSVDYALTANVEDLTLTGTAISGTGNALDNLIIGNSANNILSGGGGTDRLEGGAGKDLYLWNAGDGNDRIEDGDAQGVIVVNGQILTGGVRLAQQGAYISADGAITYTVSGGDLFAQVGGNTLIINENFQSGQLGIRLIDESSYANGLPTNTLPATEGDNVLVGVGAPGTVNWLLDGAGGNDEIHGASNNDQLYGGSGMDLLFGRDGNDQLFGGSEQDFLHGDTDEVGWPTDGADRLEGNEGNDELVGGWGSDLLFGGTGDDKLWGDSLYKVQNTPTADDYLDGGDGNDELHGLVGDDVLIGGPGNDFLSGEEGNDIEEGGAGDDLLLGYTGDDTLSGGSGTDTLYGDLDHDVLAGGDGVDTLYGGDGTDTLMGGAGADLLVGDGLNNPSQAGNVGGADLLDGGADNDELQGGVGADTLFGGTGDDLLFGDEDADSLFGDDGADELQGGVGNDSLSGGAGNDLLLGQDGADSLVGDAGNDELQGGDGTDVLAGGDGDDQLFGQAGDDVLEGGTGTDVLAGGTGADTYVFNLGDGVETIQDTAGEGNRLVFGAGISSADLSLGLGSLLIRIGTGGDAIHIEGFDANNPTTPTGIELFEFADGTILTHVELIARGFDLVGTNGDNILDTGEFYRRAFGLDGNDQITGGTGDNTLDGGAGSDVLWGGAGNDTLLGGGPEGDTLFGEAGDDQLEGGDGSDALIGGDGADVLIGGAGNDQLYGDAGADQLFGGAGDDDVVMDQDDTVADGGDGVDRIFFQGFFGVTYDLGAGHFEYASGTEGNDTLIATSAIDTVQLFGGGGDDTLTGGFGNDLLVGGESFVGADGADTLTGGAGNDQLEGGSGEDTYIFNLGDGQDTITDSAVRGDPFGGGEGEGGGGGNILENNRIVFGAGITSAMPKLSFDPALTSSPGSIGTLLLTIGSGDSLTLSDFDPLNLYGSHAIETFQFDDGTVLSNVQFLERGFDIAGTNDDETIVGTILTDRLSGLDGQDILRSGLGDDVLDGGTGNDQLFGGLGNDTYVFAVGGGQDILFDPTGNDTIRMGDGIAPEDVQGAREGNDLVLTLQTGDSLRLQELYRNPTFQVEQVTFADGTVWDQARLLLSTHRQIDGTAGADVLAGGATDDAITGLAGDDTLTGFAGDDLLDGGSDADAMAGGLGDDIYVVDDAGDVVTEAVGEGADTVQSWIAYALGANVENLTLAGSAAIDGTGNELDNMLTGNSGANVLTGGAGNDTYVIGAGDTVMEALDEGMDTVVTDQSHALGANVENLTLTGSAAVDGTGNELDNVLTGNSAANVLTGGAGDDTYVIGTGDTVVEQTGEGTDTVVTDQNYALGANLENLTLTGNRSVNGTGNELDNVLTGNAAANVLIGGAGNDSYVVGLGDIVVESTGEGTDTIQAAQNYTLGANVENLTLLDTFPTLSTGLTSGTGGGAEVGPASSYFGTGNELDNVLIGNRASNVLDGQDGNDVLDGREGNDTLKGGAGADNYLFGLGYGRDRIEDQSLGGEIDTIQLAPGLLPNQIGVVQSGSDLVLRMPGSQDELTLANFFGPTAYAQKAVQFENGTVWDEAMLRTLGADPGPGITLIDNSSNSDGLFVGGSGNDVIQGDNGNDTLIGGAGNDILREVPTGAHPLQTNTFDGGPGDDFLVGGNDNDTFIFGRGYGHDSILVDAYNPSFNFWDSSLAEADTIQLTGILRSDVEIEALPEQSSIRIRVLDSADQLTLRYGQPISNFTPVTLRFEDGASQSLSFLGPFDPAPSSAVFSSVDYTLGNSEQNLVLVDTNSSVIPNPRVGTGNALDNVILGNTADNILEGGAGNDVLNGGFARSVENILFIDSGSDALLGGEGDDVLVPFGESAFSFNFGVGADPNPFNTPDDVLLGGPGNDTYVIQHAGQAVAELVDEGIDTVRSTVSYALPDNFENLVLASGFDEETGMPGLIGTGNSLDNVLIGGGGEDVLIGNAGQDTLHGGSGSQFYDYGLGTMVTQPVNDTLVGGAGNDAYLFNRGDGTDTIQDTALSGEGNRILFGIGIAQSDLTFATNQNMLTITVNDNGGALRLEGFDPTGVNGSLVAQTLQFADGSTLNLADLFASSVNAIEGTDDDDILVSTAGEDIVNALGGNDYVEGRGGNDRLDGGAGDDQLFGNSGNDVLLGGDGNDSLRGEYAYDIGDAPGDDVLDGGLGNDSLFGNGGNDTLMGGEGNDGLSGEEGNDVLEGGLGDDILTGGTGADIIRGGDGNDWLLVDGEDTVVDGGAGYDTVSVQGATGAALDLATLEQVFGGVGDDVFIASMPDQLVNRYVEGGAGNDSIAGGAGGEQLFGRAGNDTLAGGAGNDTLAGEYSYDVGDGPGNDSLDGGDGSDQLIGGAGDDTLLGGAGDDALYGDYPSDPGSGNDILDGGEGNDGLIGGAGNDVLRGGAGDDWLNGGEGADALEGGSGDDAVIGGIGDDTYAFRRGDGNDIVFETDETPSNTDTIAFASDINPLDLMLERSADDLRMAIYGTTDSIRVQNWYGGTANQTEVLQAGNGQHLLNSQVDQLIQAMAGFGAQTGLTWEEAIAQRPDDVQQILAASWR